MDKVGEFLTRIRNAGLAKHEKVDIPSSNFRVGLATVLRDTGYINNFKVVKDGKQGIMRIYLKYDADGRHVITDISRASRPGRRLYVRSEKNPDRTLWLRHLDFEHEQRSDGQPTSHRTKSRRRTRLHNLVERRRNNWGPDAKAVGLQKVKYVTGW